MSAIAKMDEMGKPAWIIAMILGFVVFWPIGLAILGYMIWSGRMGCRSENWSKGGRDDWRAMRQEWKDKKREWKQQMRKRWHEGHDASPMRPSGNAAFDDYKADTLRRLEEEQNEFNDFLANLRKSKDKAEFDQFMASRRNGDNATDTTIIPPAPTDNS